MIILYILMIAAGSAFLGWLGYRFVTTKKKRDALMKSSENKEPEEWTDEERAVRLQHLEMLRSTGHLSFTEYDVLKAKYTGTKSFTALR